MATIKGLHAFLIKEQFRKTLQAKGYAFFGLENKAAYNVNIIGVRSEVDIFNKFDDALLVVIYRDSEREIGKYEATLSPRIQARYGMEKANEQQRLCHPCSRSISQRLYKIDGHGKTRYEAAMCQRITEM